MFSARVLCEQSPVYDYTIWLFKEEDQCLFQPVRPLLRRQINFFIIIIIIIIIILDPNEASYVLLPYVVQS